MILTGRFTFYRIDACGYFKHGDSSPRFGDPGTSLEQLYQWVRSSGTVLRDTCTFAVDNRHGVFGVYCFDLARAGENGDYLLTTWNEIPAVAGKIPVVNGTEPVGQARVEFSNFPADGIPGYPAYFWFLPADYLFATITFNSVLNGHQNLVQYLTGFLRTHSAYAHHSSRADGTAEVTGYRLSADDQPERLYPRFQSSRCRRRRTVDYIRDNREAISKCIRKLKVEPNSLPDVNLFQQVLSHATGIDKQGCQPAPVRLRYEISMTPSAEDLHAMIREWNRAKGDDWNDIGFRITTGGGRISWLSQGFARADFDLDVDCSSAPALAAGSLLSAIGHHRNAIRSVVE